MKKFFICLLIVCTICLSCFALTACDNDTEEVSKLEFVKNEYHSYKTNSGITQSYNTYTFRLWYPYQWFLDRHSSVGIRYKLSLDDEEYEYPVMFAEYIYRTDLDNTRYAIKPDSWIYTEIQYIITAPNIIYFEAYIQKAIYDDKLNWIDTETIILYQSQIDLTGTFKTA